MLKVVCFMAAVSLASGAPALAASAANAPAGGHLIQVAGYDANPAAQLGSAANSRPENSPTPAALAYKIVPGDPAVVTNGPILDTAANRARYGEPMSAAGRSSEPTGD